MRKPTVLAVLAILALASCTNGDPTDPPKVPEAALFHEAGTAFTFIANWQRDGAPLFVRQGVIPAGPEGIKIEMPGICGPVEIRLTWESVGGIRIEWDAAQGRRSLSFEHGPNGPPTEVAIGTDFGRCV